MFKVTNPPRFFAAVSLLMIIAMVMGTGLVQAPFYRQSIIDREASVVGDMVYAIAVDHQVSSADMQNYTDEQAKRRLDLAFATLTKLPGAARIKVFNQDKTIIWSDDASLVGTQRTGHPIRLGRAMAGEVQAVFNGPDHHLMSGEQAAPAPATIECYVPIFAKSNGLGNAPVIGVLSLYRDTQDVNQTIQEGLYLLWAVIGGFGLLLFVVLYKVFSLAYFRQKTAESNLSKLTLEHERIVQIEKMSAMGELVGEIAHQLNNPLVGVINLSQLAEREIRNPERVADLLAQVRKAGTECRDIVQRILRINQISRSELHPTDIKELVKDTITFCHQSVDVRKVVNFVESDPMVSLNVDPVLIRQALFNLIHNAILAAPESQVLVEATAAEYERLPGVMLSVTDSGPGYSKETAAKLFKPFFTTRANGTGLGLSVAQHIAMKHGGVVLAENLPKGGAKFSIWLPMVSTS